MHDLAAMNLERDFADAELTRRLLVEKTADHEGEDLPFTRCQGCKALLERGEFGSRESGFTILRNGRMDRSQQGRIAEWLCQEVDRSGLERAHRARNVAMSRDEYDWRVMLDSEPALKIQAVDVRKIHVQDQASRQVRLRKLEVPGGGSE